MRDYHEGRVRWDTDHRPHAWIYEVRDAFGNWRTEVRLVPKDGGDIRVELYAKPSDGLLIPKGAGLILAAAGISVPQRRYRSADPFQINLGHYFAEIPELRSIENGAMLAQRYEQHYKLFHEIGGSRGDQRAHRR